MPSLLFRGYGVRTDNGGLHMFTIQYQDNTGNSKLQTFDSNSRQKLAIHLARFNCPIDAVYEQGTPITKAMQEDLRTYPGTLTRHAKEFSNSRA